MAQRTVKTYDAFISALEALTPNGGKIILDPDPSIAIPADGGVDLPAGSWDIVGKTAEATLTLQGQLRTAVGASAVIHGCNLDLTVPSTLNVACFVGDIQVKDVTFAGDLDSQFVAAGWQIVDTAVVEITDDTTPAEDTEPNPDPTDVDPDPTEEPSTDNEPVVDPEPEPTTLDTTEPEPAADPEPVTEPEPAAEPEPAVDPEPTPSTDAQPESTESSGSSEDIQSKRVANVAIHIGPSAKSRSNAFTGAINVTSATATDALGHVWVKVTYKLPGSGKRAEGFVRQDKIQ